MSPVSPLRRLATVPLSLLMTLLIAAAAHAQPMADRVPQDSLFYAGWAGANADTPGYSDSHLKALIDETQMPMRVRRLVDALIANQIRDDDAEQFRDVFFELAPIAYAHPWAFYVGGVDFDKATERGVPQMSIGFMIDAGDEAATVEKYLRMIHDEMARDEHAPPVSLTNEGGMVTFLLGQKPAGEMGFAKGPKVREAMAEVNSAANPTLVIWADFEKLDQVIEGGIQFDARQRAVRAREWDERMDAVEDVRDVGEEEIQRPDFEEPAEPMRPSPRTTRPARPGEVGRTDVTNPEVLGAPPVLGQMEPQEGPRPRGGDLAMKRPMDDGDLRNYRQIRDALGLKGLKSKIVVGSFTPDGNFKTSAFIHAPQGDGGRTGLLKLLIDNDPLDQAQLNLIPSTAVWFRAGKFDPQEAKALTISLLRQFDLDALQRLQRNIVEMERELGFNPVTDLVDTLGDTWVLYSDPAVTSPFGPGLVIVHALKDPARFEATLATVQERVNTMLQQEGAPFALSTADTGEMKIHSLAIPVPMPSLAPSWTVADGKLFISMNPQGVMTAHAAATDEAGPMDGKKIADAMGRIQGEAAPDSVGYVDLEALVRIFYFQASNGLAILVQTAELDAETADAVKNLLPPMNTILPHLGPAADRIWHDEKGLHYESISPFPLAALASPDAGLALGAPAVAVALPALGAARRSARDVVSVSNVRLVLIGTHAYAAEHRGNMPAGLADLRPYVGDELARSSSYVYLGGGKNIQGLQNIATHVLVYEKPYIDTRDGQLAVGFADGHVERMSPWELASRLEEQGTPVPADLQFGGHGDMDVLEEVRETPRTPTQEALHTIP